MRRTELKCYVVWRHVRQLIYTSLLPIITLPFACGESKICSIIKKSQNIIKIVVAKRIVICVSKSEKVIIHLIDLRQLLKGCRNPKHVISKSIFNAKLQGPAPNPNKDKNVIPFVTTYYPKIDNKSLMQAVKNKFKNLRNKHLKSTYKDTNFIQSLKQPKHLYRELAHSRFMSNFKNIRESGT